MLLWRSQIVIAAFGRGTTLTTRRLRAGDHARSPTEPAHGRRATLGFAEDTHRAPPPERASTFGCAVVPARPAQGATLTLRKQRSPGLCRTSRSTLATAPFSDRHPRLAAPCNSSAPGKEEGPHLCGPSERDEWLQRGSKHTGRSPAAVQRGWGQFLSVSHVVFFQTPSGTPAPWDDRPRAVRTAAALSGREAPRRHVAPSC